MALGTADLDLALASGHSNLLSAGRAGIDSKCPVPFSLFGTCLGSIASKTDLSSKLCKESPGLPADILEILKEIPGVSCQLQEFLVLIIAFGQVPGKGPETRIKEKQKRQKI